MNEPENLKAQAAADQENARIRDQREASPDGMTPAERAVAASSLQHLTIAQRAQQIDHPAAEPGESTQ